MDLAELDIPKSFYPCHWVLTLERTIIVANVSDSYIVSLRHNKPHLLYTTLPQVQKTIKCKSFDFFL